MPTEPKNILACGCASSAKRDDGTPSCPIHGTIEEAKVQPDLTGRFSECSYGEHDRRPSSTTLAFFEYRGPGSRAAEQTCKNCRYHEVAHHPRDDGRAKNPNVCDSFEAVGAFDTDKHYCGCWGWD